MQRLRSRKERKRVPLVSHPSQDEIKAPILPSLQLEILAQSLLVFERALFRIGIFAFDPRDLLGLQWRFRNHRLRSHSIVAVRMVGRDMAFVAEEQMYFIPSHLRTQRRIIYNKAVERVLSRTSSQLHILLAFDPHC